MTDFDPVPQIAKDLALASSAVGAVVRLLGDGATVPFVARYRKEATGGLDEVQIRAIGERMSYLEELEGRRRSILASLTADGKLTPELGERVQKARTKSELEDLYLPYKKKRRTRATIARELGLEPLALRILAQPERADRRAEAAKHVKEGVDDAEAALALARDIVAEVVSERADVRAVARRIAFETGELVGEAPKKRADAEERRFERFEGFRERVATIPSHRYLALRRGEAEKALRVSIVIDEQRLIAETERLMRVAPRSPFGQDLVEAILDSAKRLLEPSVENDLSAELKRRADESAAEVFGKNLESLLLAAPLGEKGVIGIDPGLRTGAKCAVVDATGKLVEYVTIFPITQPDRAKESLRGLLSRHTPEAIAVGNGTGGRETQVFVAQVLKDLHRSLPVVSVNEAGASVYSASDLARAEFPELDVTIRGAISIARRLQDPLAELVKIEPKSIGVGQYQHDVAPTLLDRKLAEVVESCVNRVGVELNTASASLLSYVSGIGPKLAAKIVAHRDATGPFESRKGLLSVSGLGKKTFEQSAGFLRVRRSPHPLDASAVHPERYVLVERMAKDLGVGLGSLLGRSDLLRALDPARYFDGEIGLPTIRDIISELEKPGRDPRASFEPPRFREDVTELQHLVKGMSLEGVVTNVTHFGAFVDVGVHQDGLVHVSELADRFVRDPAEVVSVGDRIRVRVLDVDVGRKRISLSARTIPRVP
ncbi:MAG: RNA-binding transcriptional accessory protein [Deltaproteobacteria bacterium]|nr:RNA-binding transcriptional accessory protein [Deltaproteobacteria bacterium]